MVVTRPQRPATRSSTGGETGLLTRASRHPLLLCALLVLVYFAGGQRQSEEGGPIGKEPATAESEVEEKAVGEERTPVHESTESAVVVPDFTGMSLAEAAADSETRGWEAVEPADASAERRTVYADDPGWRVCFQRPDAQTMVQASRASLTLYAVPEQEECPIRLYGPGRLVMPDLVGERLKDAARTLDELGLHRVGHLHAHTGKTMAEEPGEPEAWQVCRQRPEPETVISTRTGVDLWLIDAGVPCAEPEPEPTPSPAPVPMPQPEPQPEAQPSRDGSSGGSSSGGSGGSGSGGGGGGQPGLQFGRHCSPVGALATTFDGRPAKCFMGKDGNARWGYHNR